MSKSKPARTWWGQALEVLRERRDKELQSINPKIRFSRYRLAKMAGMENQQYNNFLHRGKVGPTLMVVNKLLLTMGYTWLDWGKACQTISVPVPETTVDYQNTIIRETIAIYQSQATSDQPVARQDALDQTLRVSKRKPQVRRKKRKTDS